MGRPDYRALNTLLSVREEMADTYRAIKNGEADANVGRARVFALQQLAELIKGATLEQAVRRLERREQQDDQAEDLHVGLRAD